MCMVRGLVHAQLLFPAPPSRNSLAISRHGICERAPRIGARLASARDPQRREDAMPRTYIVRTLFPALVVASTPLGGCLGGDAVETTEQHVTGSDGGIVGEPYMDESGQVCW